MLAIRMATPNEYLLSSALTASQHLQNLLYKPYLQPVDVKIQHPSNSTGAASPSPKQLLHVCQPVASHSGHMTSTCLLTGVWGGDHSITDRPAAGCDVLEFYFSKITSTLGKLWSRPVHTTAHCTGLELLCSFANAALDVLLPLPLCQHAPHDPQADTAYDESGTSKDS